MKLWKMLALLTVVAGASMSLAAIAGANPLTSPAGTFYTGEIKAESEGATKLHGAFNSVKCSKSTIEGKVESHDSTTAAGKAASLTFGECNYPVKVLNPGSIEIHSTGGGNATATSSGAEITIETSVGSCIFKTSGTDIGTLTDSGITGGAATLDIGSSGVPRTGHSVFCGSLGTWTGSYEVTTPSSLYIDKPNPLTSPAGTFYTGEIKAESEGATKLHGAFNSVKCSKSTIEGKVESHDSTTAAGKAASLTFGECNYPVKVLNPGSIEIHSTGSDDATATSSGAEITIETSVGSCIFKTSGTDIGTLTGTDTTGSNATLDVGSSSIPRTGHSVFCGSLGTWTGSYEVTTPSSLYID